MNPADQGGRPSGEHVQGAPPIKRGKGKNFKLSWLQLPEFSGWLKPINGQLSGAQCNICNRDLTGGKSEFLKHAAGKYHIKKAALARAGKESPSKPLCHADIVNTHTAEVKVAEIRMSAFIADHNIAIQAVDDLAAVCKSSFKDSRIAEDVSLGRTKCSNIIVNCLAKRELEKIVEVIRIQKFSILIDESTDITDTKFLCVLVQFRCPEKKKVVTALFELIKLDAQDCSAESVYNRFKRCLEANGVPITNIVGMASDNASVMIGIHNSFMTRLKSDAPGLVVMNCICHSAAIIASKACARLPRALEDLIRSISTYVSGSAKRCAVLCEVQELLDLEKRKILKLSNTRWLSMQNCVVRLLENWDALKIYFALAVTEDKLKSAEEILESLCSDRLKIYLIFLKYALTIINSFNILFQSRRVLIHKLAEKSRLLIAQLGSKFLKVEVINELMAGNLNVADPRNLVPLDQVNLGLECAAALANVPEIVAIEIRQTCLVFYTTAVTEMARRLPLKSSLLDDVQFVEPNIALDSNKNLKNLTNVVKVAQRFGSFSLTELEIEWSSLPFAFPEEKKQELLAFDVESFWSEIMETKNFADEKQFPILAQIVSIVLSLPHSNAEAERIFSIVTDVKTKKRNRIGQKCLDAICRVRLAFQNAGTNCSDFKIDERHLALHSTENLYPSQQPDAV